MDGITEHEVLPPPPPTSVLYPDLVPCYVAGENGPGQYKSAAGIVTYSLSNNGAAEGEKFWLPQTSDAPPFLQLPRGATTPLKRYVPSEELSLEVDKQVQRTLQKLEEKVSRTAHTLRLERKRLEETSNWKRALEARALGAIHCE